MNAGYAQFVTCIHNFSLLIDMVMIRIVCFLPNAAVTGILQLNC